MIKCLLLFWMCRIRLELYARRNTLYLLVPDLLLILIKGVFHTCVSLFRVQVTKKF